MIAAYQGTCPTCGHENKPLNSTSALNDVLFDGLSTFRVHVSEMVESCGKTYWVCLDRGDRPLDAKPWDDGRITPFKHKNKEYAEAEATTWAKFLGVEVSK
jgi:hypothetical protein